MSRELETIRIRTYRRDSGPWPFEATAVVVTDDNLPQITTYGHGDTAHDARQMAFDRLSDRLDMGTIPA